MKKLLYAFALLLGVATVSNAQNFKPFKLGIGVGTAIPNRGEGGGLFYIEPAYRPSNTTLVGLRIESAVLAKDVTTSGGDVRGNAKANTSYTLNGQYYFNEDYVRPFVGVGFGLFQIADIRYNNGSEVVTTSGGNSFGLYPRIGVDVGHLNLTVDYNVIPSTSVDGGEIRNSYLALRAGLSIGGGEGKKRK